MAEKYPIGPPSEAPPPFESQPLNSQNIDQKYPSSFANQTQPTGFPQPGPDTVQPQYAPMPVQTAPVSGNNDFKYGLFDCFSNFGLCCIVFFVPCVPFGEISQETGYGNCVSHGGLFCCLTEIPGSVNILICLQRAHVRKTYGLGEDRAWEDCLVSCCCPLCAICQMARQTSKYSMGENRFVEQNMSRQQGRRLVQNWQCLPCWNLCIFLI